MKFKHEITLTDYIRLIRVDLIHIEKITGSQVADIGGPIGVETAGFFYFPINFVGGVMCIVESDFEFMIPYIGRYIDGSRTW
jgi:hypothetical protein